MNNQEEGPFLDYYENGQLRQKGAYNDGRKNGPVELYYENGQLAGKGTYNSELGDWRFGELIGEIS